MSLAFLPAPRPAGVVHDFQSKPNTITIVRTSDFNQYIRPPTNDTEVREDFVLTGFVIVHLREARKAKELKIRFVAEARLAYPGELEERHRHAGNGSEARADELGGWDYR